MVRAELTVESAQGIHLGPANLIANTADKFDSSIHFKTEYMDINAKSIINIVSGTLRYGDTFLCVCDGPDEKKALAAMKELMAQDLEDLL
ncbi:MAG: HPr family phosphocarrier protein [Eubacteriales bacterium]|nr:HPr family phosphocarrier protein [Eubacteriales bacterium]